MTAKPHPYEAETEKCACGHAKIGHVVDGYCLAGHGCECPGFTPVPCAPPCPTCGCAKKHAKVWRAAAPAADLATAKEALREIADDTTDAKAWTIARAALARIEEKL